MRENGDQWIDSKSRSHLDISEPVSLFYNLNELHEKNYTLTHNVDYS